MILTGQQTFALAFLEFTNFQLLYVQILHLVVILSIYVPFYFGLQFKFL